MFSNGFRPVFAGRLYEDRRATVLKASYGAPGHLLAFYVLWYTFLAVIAVIGVALLFGAEGGTSESWILAIVLPLFGFFPIGAHLFANRKADEHFDAILEHLASVADLRPEARTGRRA